MSLTDSWSFLLPPGWMRFPSGTGRAPHLEEAVEQVMSRTVPTGLPYENVERVRRRVQERLRTAIADAGVADVGTLYLPIAPVDGVVMPASIVEREFDSDPQADPLDALAAVIVGATDASELVDVDGRPAVRIEGAAQTAQQDARTAYLSRQVLYAMSRDDDGHWLVLSFSVVWTSPESARLADALVSLFDAVMTTFRWTGQGDPSAASATVPKSVSHT